MSLLAARIRLRRVGSGVALAVAGGAGLVGLATAAEGGSAAQGLTTCDQLLPGLLALGGALAGARAGARGEDRALAALGAAPAGWRLAALATGTLAMATLRPLNAQLATGSAGWVRGTGGWFHEGLPLADHAGGIVWPVVPGLVPGLFIGAAACAGGLACGRASVSRTLRLAGALGMAALAILAQHGALLAT